MGTLVALCILVSAIFIIPYLLITVVFGPIMWLGSALSNPFDWLMTKAASVFVKSNKVTR